MLHYYCNMGREDHKIDHQKWNIYSRSDTYFLYSHITGQKKPHGYVQPQGIEKCIFNPVWAMISKLIIYVKCTQSCINLFIFLCVVHCTRYLFSLNIYSSFGSILQTWTQPTLERLKHQNALQGSLNKGEFWIWSWRFILESSELANGVRTLGYYNSQYIPKNFKPTEPELNNKKIPNCSHYSVL